MWIPVARFSCWGSLIYQAMTNSVRCHLVSAGAIDGGVVGDSWQHRGGQHFRRVFAIMNPYDLLIASTFNCFVLALFIGTVCAQ